MRGCRPDRWAIRIENAACLRKHLHEAEPSFDSAHPLYAGREVLSHDDSEAFVMRIALAAGSERLFEPPFTAIPPTQRYFTRGEFARMPA